MTGRHRASIYFFLGSFLISFVVLCNGVVLARLNSGLGIERRGGGGGVGELVTKEGP